jgi:hypothetical protein
LLSVETQTAAISRRISGKFHDRRFRLPSVDRFFGLA